MVEETLADEERKNGLDAALENAVVESLEEERKAESTEIPDELCIFPILRRPFFPGMAAPIVVEPGPFYEILKLLAKSDHKCLGLVLTKSETCDIYKATFKDLYPVGVVARILRVIPMEQGGAQVVLNMEKRFKISKPIPTKKHLLAKVKYFEEKEPSSKELKAYSISIISTIKELLKLNPLFKEELQIFLSHSDFTEPGEISRLRRRPYHRDKGRAARRAKHL